MDNYLEKKTDLNIKPSRVRTTNTEKDGYCWLYKPEVAHLFSRCLSRQPLSTYEQLCSGVGDSFEAIAAPRAPKDPYSPRNLILPPPTPRAKLSNRNPEIEPFNKGETHDTPTELQELLLSIRQSLVTEREGRDAQKSEMMMLQTEYDRLTEKYNDTMDAMGRCIGILDVVTASVGELRYEISESIKSAEYKMVL